jgi:GAF domain-containing protein
MSGPDGILEPGKEAFDLESVIATADLETRSVRAPDPAAEGRATLDLVLKLSKSPSLFFQTLVETALKLSRAESTGISLLDRAKGRFIWPAVAGPLASYLGQGTPRDFGPCGTVLDRNAPVLFLHPERHFTYLEPITPPLEEVLLIPFHMDGKAVGTIWAVIHQKERKFDAEDERVLVNLSAFAASAYKTLVLNRQLEPILAGKFALANC